MVQLAGPNGQPFDANTVAPNAGLEPVPEGWYNVAIDTSDMKPTSSGSGAFLQLVAKIIDGQYAGKPIFIRLNLQNSNPQAVDIAYGELSAICHVTGVFQLQDSSQLHGLPFQVRVVVRPGGTGADGKVYDASNEVKGYRDGAGNEPGKAAAPGGNAGGFGAPAAGSPPPNTNFGGQQPTQQAAQPGQQQPAQQQQPPQGQQQPDPTQQPQNGGGFAGGNATQPAQQPPQEQGNAGWTQQQQQQQQPAQGQAAGGAPWGVQGGQG